MEFSGHLIAVLRPAVEGGCVVTIEGLPEVITEGDTEEEAVEAAREAALSAMLTRLDQGQPLLTPQPEPTPEASDTLRRLITPDYALV